jgi:hypothetical protein
MCYLSVVLLYYCHRAEAQLQFTKLYYKVPLVVMSPIEGVVEFGAEENIWT